jgi:hypothetical protein
MSGLMRRKKVTAYPDCELPYLAALLRHAALWTEVAAAAPALLAGTSPGGCPGPRLRGLS